MKTKDFSRITKIRIDRWFASGIKVEVIFRRLPRHHTINQLKSYLGIPLEEIQVETVPAILETIEPSELPESIKTELIINKDSSDNLLEERKAYNTEYRRRKRIERTLKDVLKSRISRFDKTGNKKSQFSIDDLLSKVTDTPVCYLTGKPLDLNDYPSYEMDHIIPKSRNGGHSLENCGLALKDANRSKAYMTVSEFVELCKSVVEYNGFVVTRDPHYYDWDCANSC